MLNLFLENFYLSFSPFVGKSLCFQIPALLTGKVVVVISPLISLMHDQCLKLAKHGVSACFLGSGQIDHSVEQKAIRGMYEIIYVCPETILRLNICLIICLLFLIFQAIKGPAHSFAD